MAQSVMLDSFFFNKIWHIYMQPVKFTTKNLCILTLIDQFFTFLSRITSAIISALLIFIEDCTDDCKIIKQNKAKKNLKGDLYW